MSIDQENQIDIIADDKNSHEVVLFISDHLPWSANDDEHLLKLQNKINAYLSFIESGELLKHRPHIEGKKITIEVRGKYPLNFIATNFYYQLTQQLRDAGYEYRFVLEDEL